MNLLLAVIIFTVVIIFLVALLNLASARLVPKGPFEIDVNNGSRKINAAGGGNLLSAFADNGFFLPSACGGGGTCAMCKCRITEGVSGHLPTEEGHLSRLEKRDGVHLACQIKVRNPLKVQVPETVFGIRKYQCRLRSTKSVAAFMKEFVFETRPEDNFSFKPGAYIQFHMPPSPEIPFRSLEIGEKYHEMWDRYKLWDLSAPARNEECIRAYSLANMPAEKNTIMVKVRIATPMPGTNHPAGLGSSWLFSLKEGAEVTVSGPYGDFFMKDTDREICFVGGGAGMGPMRSHIFHLFHTLKTKRKVTFWYGARSVREMCWCNDFTDIEKNHDNFTYTPALSAPEPEDKWQGRTGYIHEVLLKEYLSTHPEPGEIEYYLCGPPPMIDAVSQMLESQGVEPEMIAYDSF
jgi:Na+-transporting NADH:ubiquinone oxidoreductase subunit F